MIRNRMLLSLVLPIAVSIAACEARDEDEVEPAESAEMPAPAPATPTAEPQVIGLDEIDDSNVDGEVTATHSATDVTVSILLKQGNPQTSYPAHIHTGTCEKGGPVAVELGSVTNLQAMKTVPISSLPANQDAFVQVHDPSGKAVACGDMKGHDTDMNTGAAPATTTSY